MHRTITTLHEYRTLYPESAPIPTLTQSGLLGLLLDRQRCKAAGLTRRRAHPSAPRHAPRVPVYGGCSPPLTYRPIISPKPLHRAMSDKICSYAELRELIRVSLRTQHPEWIEPNGDSPICDFYEARFAELLGLTRSREEAKNVYLTRIPPMKSSTGYSSYAD